MSDTRFDLSRCEDWEDALLSDLRTSASNVAVRFQAHRREIAKCYAEIDRLKATAVDAMTDAINAAHGRSQVTRARETIDGIDCERISGLDVIVPVGLIPDGEEPKEVRSCRLSYVSRWLSVDIRGPVQATHGADHALRLMLADKPAPAPVLTWTPPVSLPDGVYSWKSTRLEKAEIDEDGRKSTWADWSPGESYKDWTSPPETGEWQVESGCATYLGPNEESPQ